MAPTEPSGWDTAKASAALAAVFWRIEAALRRREANTPSRRAALETCRAVALQHAKDHDSALFGEAEDVDRLIRSWCRPGPAPGDNWWEEKQ
jgi:hypothetical protein